MAYRGTDIKELARETAQAVIDAAGKIGSAAYDIHIFLQVDGQHQEWENGRVGNIPMYGVHCDQSYGGTDEAEEAVRENLPNALIIFEGGATEDEAAEAERPTRPQCHDPGACQPGHQPRPGTHGSRTRDAQGQ